MVGRSSHHRQCYTGDSGVLALRSIAALRLSVDGGEGLGVGAQSQRPSKICALVLPPNSYVES